MSTSSRGLQGIVALSIVLCIVASLTGAHAEQEKSAPSLRVAVVDTSKVMNGSNKIAQLKAWIEKQEQDGSTVLRAYANNPYLTDKEQVEVGDLVMAQATPVGLTAQQQARLTELTNRSKAANDEFTTLQQKPEAQLTAQDHARMTELMKDRTATNDHINQVKAKKSADLEKEFNQRQQDILKDVRETISKVAKEKGYNLVFDGSVCLTAEGDLSNDVLNTLNK